MYVIIFSLINLNFIDNNNLRLKKIRIGTQILLPNTTESVIISKEGNEVFFDMSRVEQINRYIYSEENCGNFIVVGALKDVGYSYWQIIGIISGCIIFVIIVVIVICYAVLVHIINKNKKGKYYAHKEENEKTVGIKGNISNTTTKGPIIPNK